MSTAAIQAQARSETFRRHLVNLLMEVCRIDTTPQADVALSAKAERQVFDIVRREFERCRLPQAHVRFAPIDSAIEQHPFFSRLYYTVTPECPGGLSVHDCYRGRGNLLLLVDGEGSGTGVDQAVNVHIDVVKPYIPPRVEGGRVLGRGTCDDKGPLVAFLGALKLVGDDLQATGRRLGRNLTGMIVIEEETGGNGSLSLALDSSLKRRYQSLMVLECCGNRIHPGNRGALWYKIEAKAAGGSMNLLEAAAFIIEELEKEGRAIKAESRHPLFPQRPVQTCHGVIGPFGEHPSRICGRVDFEIQAPATANARLLIADLLESALADYTGLYGDKTKVLDGTGRPRVDHHYDLIEAPGGLLVRVHGSSGHMGSILENDSAITKMATMVRALVRSRPAIESAVGRSMRLRLAGWQDSAHLVMEGGQGFLPTHDLPQIMDRLRQAVLRGAEACLRQTRLNGAVRLSDCFVVSYDKLHNAAFAGDPESPDMRHAVDAAKLAGTWIDEHVRGWDSSSDARIFACQHPGLPVLTSGPGLLAHAHGDQEQIEIDDMVKSAEFLAYFILRQTGTLG